MNLAINNPIPSHSTHTIICKIKKMDKLNPDDYIYYYNTPLIFLLPQER